MDNAHDQAILKAFGENLKRIRDEKKLSTRELAAIAEVDYGHINEIENGKKNPGLLLLHALAEALGIHPRELIP